MNLAREMLIGACVPADIVWPCRASQCSVRNGQGFNRPDAYVMDDWR